MGLCDQYIYLQQKNSQSIFGTMTDIKSQAQFEFDWAYMDPESRQEGL